MKHSLWSQHTVPPPPQRYLTNDGLWRVRKIFNVVIAKIFTNLRLCIGPCQNKYKMFECWHATIYNKYTLIISCLFFVVCGGLVTNPLSFNINHGAGEALSNLLGMKGVNSGVWFHQTKNTYWTWLLDYTRQKGL